MKISRKLVAISWRAEPAKSPCQTCRHARAERPRAIAVVDDEPTIREMVVRAAPEGYEVSEHTDGLEAWQSFEGACGPRGPGPFMPRMDVWSSAAASRRSEKLPIIF